MALEMMRLEAAVLLRPLLSRLPRGYGTAYSRLLGPIGSTYLGDPLFKSKLTRRHRIFYDRHLDCYVLADVGDAGSRNHFVLGRHYENFVPLLIKRFLGPGDTFIDVGANRGVHTMFAARHLTQGRIISFEPNTMTFRILQAHVTINNLTKCKLYNMGLGETNDTLTLHLFSDDAPSGCSFIEKGESPVKETFQVPVRRLEEMLRAEGNGMRGRTLIKVDTEGFDHHVLRGLGDLIDHDELVIVTEVVDDWLRKAGSSARGLFEDLVGHGFRAFVPSIRFLGGLKETIHLEPISQVPERSDQFDLVFAKPRMMSEAG